MKVGVTGASGHIGLHICAELIKRGYEVVAFVHNGTNGIRRLPVAIMEGNVLNKPSLLQLTGTCDAVIHSAGLIRLGYGFDSDVYDVNVTGTANLIEAALSNHLKKMVFISSIHVFNHAPRDIPIDESRGFVPDKSVFYDRTKRDAHLLVKKAAAEGLNAAIVCPTGVLGPHDYKPSQLGKAIIDIYRGSVPAVVSGGFDFVDVRDVANGVIAAMEKGRAGETYILGGKYWTVKQFADLVLQLKGSKKRLPELPLFLAYACLPFVKAYARLAGKMPLYDRAYLDILRSGNKEILSTKAMDELNYSARALDITITDTLRWFKDAGKI